MNREQKKRINERKKRILTNNNGTMTTRSDLCAKRERLYSNRIECARRHPHHPSLVRTYIYSSISILNVKSKTITYIDLFLRSRQLSLLGTLDLYSILS